MEYEITYLLHFLTETYLQEVYPSLIRIFNGEISEESSCQLVEMNPKQYTCTTWNFYVTWKSNGSLEFDFNNTNITEIMIVFDIDNTAVDVPPHIIISGSSFPHINLTPGLSNVTRRGNEIDVSQLTLNVIIEGMQTTIFRMVRFFNRGKFNFGG